MTLVHTAPTEWKANYGAGLNPDHPKTNSPVETSFFFAPHGPTFNTDIPFKKGNRWVYGWGFQTCRSYLCGIRIFTLPPVFPEEKGI